MILFDPRGHRKIADALSDISETATLAHGDCFWMDDRFTWGVEIKSFANLLSSIVTVNEETGYSQLYTQLKNLVDFYDIPILLVYGIWSPTKDGTIKIPEKKEPFGWRYASIEGLLFDAWAKGVCPITRSSAFAASLTIRALYNYSQKEGRTLELRKAKFFSYTGETDHPLRIVCSLPGINMVLGRRVLKHFGNARTAFASEDWAGVTGIGRKRNNAVQEILDNQSPGTSSRNVQEE